MIIQNAIKNRLGVCLIFLIILVLNGALYNKTVKNSENNNLIFSTVAATVMAYFCHTYTSFIIYLSIFGFTAGAYVGLTSVCLVDLVGLNKLTNAFGLLLLFQGIATFSGPPIAGKLFVNSFHDAKISEEF